MLSTARYGDGGMSQRSVQVFVLAALCVGIAGVGGFFVGVVPVPTSPPEEATVVVSGTDRGTTSVDVEVAATRIERYRGLSGHETLPEGEGMLFVHGHEREYTYVMREMDFGIDIVFVDADGRVTAVHNASAPDPGEDGTDQRYTGLGRFVLEVPRGYAAEHGIEAGDSVTILCAEAGRGGCLDP
jgi:uncharacterized membrane protein (UPF0127 family)